MAGFVGGFQALRTRLRARPMEVHRCGIYYRDFPAFNEAIRVLQTDEHSLDDTLVTDVFAGLTDSRVVRAWLDSIPLVLRQAMTDGVRQATQDKLIARLDWIEEPGWSLAWSDVGAKVRLGMLRGPGPS
jgi:hypothetical protein